MQWKEINLKEIETKEAETKFADSLDKPQNFLFDGVWGSGKTHFLNKIKNSEQNKTKNNKFIILDLWRTDTEKSITEYFYKKVHPFFYYIVWTLIISFVATAIAIPIILSNESLQSEGISNLITGHVRTSQTLVFIGVIVGVWQVLKIKSDDAFVFLLKKTPLCGKRKILIIDDFDRISSSRRLEIYKILDLLNGRMTIVFVGDHKILLNDGTENYLQKFVNKRFTLPLKLSSKFIWDIFFQDINKQLDENEKIDSEVQYIFTMQNRNLRDREQFTAYVNQELSNYKKFGKVNAIDQLLVIYIYLFYPNVYDYLKQDYIIGDTSEEVDESRKKTLSIEDEISVDHISQEVFFNNSTVSKVMHKNLSTYRRSSVFRFATERSRYYIAENAGGLDTEEIKLIFESPEKIIELAKVNSDEATQIFNYLSENITDMDDAKEDILLDYIIDESLAGNVLNISDVVVNDQMEKHHVDRRDKRTAITWWESRLKEKSVSQENRFTFYQIFSVASYKDLGQMNDLFELTQENIFNSNKNIQSIFVYLSAESIFYSMEKWTDDFWNGINNLETLYFIKFWFVYGIFFMKDDQMSRFKDVINFASKDALRKVYYAEERRSFETDEKISNAPVLDRIEDRIESINREGEYSINKVESE